MALAHEQEEAEASKMMRLPTPYRKEARRRWKWWQLQICPVRARRCLQVVYTKGSQNGGHADGAARAEKYVCTALEDAR